MEPGPRLIRRADVVRLLTVLLLFVVTIGCGGAPSSTPPQASASGEGSDGVAVLAGDLRTVGATVTELGGFNPDPLGGRGVRLCVAGQQVSLYVYPTAQDRAVASARIDPNDPSNLGIAMVEWAGNPRFWQRDRIIVLYLGSDAAVEVGITSVLGPPFARGRGRPPGPDRNAC